MSTAIIRRSQARSSLRENRVQQSRRRPRSRSPESRPVSVASTNTPTPRSSASTLVRKRKKQPNPSLTAPTISSSNHCRQNQLNLTQPSEEEQHLQLSSSLRRGKSKTKQSGLRQNSIDLGLDRGRHSLASTGKKETDRSRSREWTWAPKTTGSQAPIDADAEPSTSYTGPLALAEFTRLKVEVERLKEQLHHSKKTIHKQSKVIDELRQEVSNVSKFNKEQTAQVEKLKSKSKKFEDLLGNIEGNLQCQICLETLLKPFTLSPCGHVLCQGCLQNWFRAAPASPDDMYDEDDPMALIYRRKSCPSCRAVIRTRPIPLFVVKSIAAAFDKSKYPDSSRHPSPPPDPDPWAGIFPDIDATMSSDEEDEDGDEDDEDDDDFGWAAYDDMHGYGSDSDQESYEGEYVPARWQPPSVHVDPQDFVFDDLDDDDFKMLRRGATLQMIELFNMQYVHAEGLSVIVDDVNRIYLGWNINLHPSDLAGEEFIDYIVNDIFERGERWEIHEDEDGPWTAWKLVPVDEDEAFDTTDSEAWEAAGDDEEE